MDELRGGTGGGVSFLLEKSSIWGSSMSIVTSDSLSIFSALGYSDISDKAGILGVSIPGTGGIASS